MKLSKAILKGCKKSQPGYCELITVIGKTTHACAIGAAMLGVGAKYMCDLEDHIGIELNDWPPVDTLPTLNDEKKPFSSLFEQLTFTNDLFVRTREEIAHGLAKAGL